MDLSNFAVESLKNFQKRLTIPFFDIIIEIHFHIYFIIFFKIIKIPIWVKFISLI